ncbi:MAG TPA: hypothetical protein VHG69_08375 [Thermoleophilaceae bacterium]|nr:hypothetical protein [Thermoleophilaceae bacterium]
MLYAVLICSDEECAQEFEAWGEPDDFERLACECGCALQAIAFCEAQPAEIRPPAAVLELRQLKRAA